MAHSPLSHTQKMVQDVIYPLHLIKRMSRAARPLFLLNIRCPLRVFVRILLHAGKMCSVATLNFSWLVLL